MHQHRHRLRLLFAILCASQLLVTGIGLVVAYQVLQSYSRSLAYERSLTGTRETIRELEALGRAASPEALDLDDHTSGPSQLSETDYACRLFLFKAHALLDETSRDRNSPLVRSVAHLQDLVSQMETVRQQSQLVGEAWAQQNTPLARARLTYAVRAATRVQEILSDIDQDMFRVKDDVLAQESVGARRTNQTLVPLAVIGALLLLPAVLYARYVDRNLRKYETELENERKLLEGRVANRTSELSIEIEYRKGLEAFNGDRNRLLEQVAEGKELREILVQLARATEQSVPESDCVVMLAAGQSDWGISSNVPTDLAIYLQTILLRTWDVIATQDVQGRTAAFINKLEDKTQAPFHEVWSRGYGGLLVVPITDSHQAPEGIIVLLLRHSREPGALAREVLLSAARMASVAVQNSHMQDELFRRAHQDSLTSLPNRALFEDRLQQALARANRTSEKIALLCIDLDGFKEINDRYGHEAGDWLLQQAAQRLTGCIRKADTVARIGGDEFVAAIGDVRESEGVEKICETLVRILGEPYSFRGVTFSTTASIGAAIFPRDAVSCEELRRHADLAMYRAKESGRNTYRMFSADLGEKLSRRRQIEKHLQDALENDGFELHYQPIYAVDRILAGFEALIRFRSPELKDIAPSEFIPIAEQAGPISSIGDWVMWEACRQGREWQEKGMPSISLAVNVSAMQLGRPDFAEAVSRILEETGFSPELLHVEITETSVMSNFEEGRRQLHALANLGIRIVIDDFGTGHSSLSYLHCLPIKALKIDRSFVRQIVESSESKAIVHAIVAMAQSLDLQVIAEGVETSEQLRAVAEAGCGLAQGYLFTPPLDSNSARSLLQDLTSPALVSSRPTEI